MNKGSRYILGTVQFGLEYGVNNTSGKPSKEKVFQILHSAHDSGITVLDSANAYGDAENIIGEFIKSTRKKFSINTKFHESSKVDINEQLRQTLEQLGVEKIEVYFYHRFEELKDIIVKDVLIRLRNEGSIKKIGVSVYTNEEFAASIEDNAVNVIQLPFNLLDNFSKRGKFIKKAKENGKELQVRSVFLQGLFFMDTGSLPQKLIPLQPYLNKIKSLAADHRLSMHDAALAYVLSKKEIDQIIIGVDSLEHLEKNLAAEQKITNHSFATEIDKIMVEEESLLYPYNWK